MHNVNLLQFKSEHVMSIKYFVRLGEDTSVKPWFRVKIKLF